MINEKVNKVLYNLGILMIISGFFILVNNIAFAQTSSEQYAEQYQVQRWRNMRAYNSAHPENVTSWVTLGPAEWRVDGSVGDRDWQCAPGESCFTETWNVEDWDNGLNVWIGCSGISFVAYEYETSSQYHDTSFGAGWGGFGNKFNWAIFPAGLYGAMVEKVNEDHCTTSAHSWPINWYVNGEITTP